MQYFASEHGICNYNILKLQIKKQSSFMKLPSRTVQFSSTFLKVTFPPSASFAFSSAFFAPSTSPNRTRT